MNSELSNENQNKHENKISPNENAKLEQQWTELIGDWQNQPYQKTDITKLITQTKRRVIGAKFCLALDVLATIGVVVAFLSGLIAGDWQVETLYYLGFGSVIAIVFCIQVIMLRLRAWKQLSDAPEKAITNAIVNCQASIKYAKLSKLSCYPMMVVANWYLYEVAIGAEIDVWPPLIFINIFVGTIWGIGHYFHRKRHKELLRLKTFLGK